MNVADKVIVVGVGNRGNTLARHVLESNTGAKIVAAADPDPDRLRAFGSRFGVPVEQQFPTYQDLFSLNVSADAVIITTMDRDHYPATMAALNHGYHVLVEKPMSTDVGETLEMAMRANETGRILMVAHELRYSSFYSELKHLITSKVIGDVVGINLTENIQHMHFAHSYVRGNWANQGRATFMLLSKSCHDVDVLCWLIDRECISVASFGSLSHFTETNAPKGSTARCIDGCLVQSTCPYSALRAYVDTDRWAAAAKFPQSKPDRLALLATSPYGRCVYRADNDVADHQSVLFEFEGGATATLNVMAFTRDETRTIKIFGTLGEIRGHMGSNEIEVSAWNGKIDVIRLAQGTDGHGGGDRLLVSDFLRQLHSGGDGGLTNAQASAESHIVTFAAEASRLGRRMINIQDFMKEVKKNRSETSGEGMP